MTLWLIFSGTRASQIFTWQLPLTLMQITLVAWLLWGLQEFCLYRIKVLIDLLRILCKELHTRVRIGYLEKYNTGIHGTGYVVQSLEAALWCFARSSSFKDAVLRAANLGEDADTTAAICGQVAGAYYDLGGIPSGWVEKLAMKEKILHLSDMLYSEEQ